MTLGTAIAQYLGGRVARRELTRETARNYRLILEMFARSVGEERPADSLGRSDIEAWLEVRSHVRPSTRRGDLGLLRTFCAWLVREGILSRNPADDVARIRSPRYLPRAMPVARTLAVCPDARARAIVWLMVGMGLRCCEVARLEVGDWDRQGQLVVVTGKNGDERALPVPPEVASAIDAYLAEYPAGSGPLIRSYRDPVAGLRASTISELVADWMRSAGVKRQPRDGVSAYALRHTAASDVLDRCGDVRVVQAMLGHRNVATTSVYLRRAALGQMREAMVGRRYLSA